ncbi:MAG: hypothetical protein M3122_07950 [Actinomycetota bacterium]|nr:hypothetical protein [Actinomycetota bacterium]
MRCAASFRIIEFLVWRRLLYVDDFATAKDARLEGHGKRMLAWLAKRAAGSFNSTPGCRGTMLIGSTSGRHKDLQLPFLEGAKERLATGILFERGSG